MIALAGSYPFLTMMSVAVCGWLLARQVTAAGDEESAFLTMKRAAARFYLERDRAGSRRPESRRDGRRPAPLQR